MRHLLDPSKPHPARGPLCDKCGTGVEAADHWDLCRHFEVRPALWAEGWVDLNAFGQPSALAEGWPEVREGPIATTIDAGFGPEQIIARWGPWVRCPGTAVRSHRRVAALAVLRAAEVPDTEAVARVVDADATTIEEWCRPALAIDTSGCGRAHQVKIDRGVATAPNHSHSASHKREPALRRFETSASCSAVIDRWNEADIGDVVGDLTDSPVPRYERTGHNPAAFGSFCILVSATLAGARSRWIEAGEPDRWLVIEGEPLSVGSPAALIARNRPIAMALVTAPPTWLWTDDPLA